MNAIAFGKTNPFGARLNAIYSSDIGHFDVIDMRDPLPEAFELVEDGFITGDDFQDFVFRQLGAAVGHAEPQLLRRHTGGERGQGAAGTDVDAGGGGVACHRPGGVRAPRRRRARLPSGCLPFKLHPDR